MSPYGYIAFTENKWEKRKFSLDQNSVLELVCFEIVKIKNSKKKKSLTPFFLYFFLPASNASVLSFKNYLREFF